jgi:adenine-specific DNA-methyltransferase
MVGFPKIAADFDPRQHAVIHPGDCLDFVGSLKAGSVGLVVTSPPYNIGKAYEKKRHLESYLEHQNAIIRECVRVLKPSGSICWQVGNYVDKGSIIPLDAVLFPIFSGLGLQMRNRIIWHFEHGLHCSKRYSGRHETIMWFTKSENYTFDLDPVRIPQKYPGKKYFKGPKAGTYSCNPLGKNPGDVWVIPNVKSNHVEKTAHPCQFPVELVERLVLSLTLEDEWVLDPFLGSGTSIIAALKHGRRGMGAEVKPEYVRLAQQRVEAFRRGELKTRPMHRPVYDPVQAGNSLSRPPWEEAPSEAMQGRLFELPPLSKKKKR